MQVISSAPMRGDSSAELFYCCTSPQIPPHTAQNIKIMCIIPQHSLNQHSGDVTDKGRGDRCQHLLIPRRCDEGAHEWSGVEHLAANHRIDYRSAFCSTIGSLRDGWIEKPEGCRSPQTLLSRMASVLIPRMVTVIVGGSARASGMESG
jgi:hypothetical protein